MTCSNNSNVDWNAECEAGTRNVLTINDVNFAFRYCPPGTTASVPGEEPTTINRAFWLLETPVTQGMWRTIMGTNPSEFQAGDNFPVENVNLYDCQEFVERLNSKNAAPKGFLFRLPQADEWEYAWKAGEPYGPRGRYTARPVEVGQIGANAWGALDTRGNVFEWSREGDSQYALLGGGGRGVKLSVDPTEREAYDPLAMETDYFGLRLVLSRKS